jgi:hypothetical protein
MRCNACNAALTDAESVRKNKTTGNYYDLCRDCYHEYKINLLSIQKDTFDTPPVILNKRET